MNMTCHRNLLIAILAVTAVLTSCSGDSAARLRYQAEKLLYDADRAARGAQVNTAADPAITRNIRDRYGEVVSFCFAALDSVPKTTYPVEHRQLSVIAYTAATRLSQMFFEGRRFDTCAALIGRLLKLADLGKTEMAISYYNYGRALQLSNQWDSAQQVYANALQIFAPPTDDENDVLLLVFNLPLRIHRAFSEAHDSANARLWFSRAEQYYQRWSSTQGQPTALSTMSLGNLARLYEDAGMWEQSAALLQKMKDPSGDVASGPKLHLADIYVEHLNRPDSALVLYDQLFNALRGPDTIFRPALMVKKSLTYIAKKEYANARELLTQVSSQWREFYAGSPSAQFNKAKCLEMENKWDRAETEYRFLIDNYQGSEEALSTYLYLAKKAATDGRARESQQWYERAEKDFDALAARGAGTTQEAIALYFKADLYRVRENWRGAAATLQRVFERFPQTDPGRRAAMMAVDIYRQKLNDNRRADSLVVAFQQAMIAVDESANLTDLSKK